MYVTILKSARSLVAESRQTVLFIPIVNIFHFLEHEGYFSCVCQTKSELQIFITSKCLVKDRQNSDLFKQFPCPYWMKWYRGVIVVKLNVFPTSVSFQEYGWAMQVHNLRQPLKL